MTPRAPRLLPLLAVAIGGVLALKAVSGLEGAPAFLKEARAMAEDASPKSAKAGKAKPSRSKPPLTGESDAAPASNAATAAAATSAPAAADAAAPAAAVRPTPICAPSAADLAKEAGLSPAELRVLQSLQSRRGELDDREKALATQLALLAAAEGKVDGKLKSLTALKGEIQVMLGQADTRQQAEVGRLVTVYSAMKPDQAAAVMSQLDDRVRIPVAGQMKERVLAAILARMAPADAKKMTEKLASRFTPSETLKQQVAAADNSPAAGQAASAATPAAAPTRRKPRLAAKSASAPKAKAAAETAAPAASTPPTKAG